MVCAVQVPTSTKSAELYILGEVAEADHCVPEHAPAIHHSLQPRGVLLRGRAARISALRWQGCLLLRLSRAVARDDYMQAVKSYELWLGRLTQPVLRRSELPCLHNWQQLAIQFFQFSLDASPHEGPVSLLSCALLHLPRITVYPINLKGFGMSDVCQCPIGRQSRKSREVKSKHAFFGKEQLGNTLSAHLSEKKDWSVKGAIYLLCLASDRACSVDRHFPQSHPTSKHVRSWNGAVQFCVHGCRLRRTHRTQ
jgi:hypothetical protein